MVVNYPTTENNNGETVPPGTIGSVLLAQIQFSTFKGLYLIQTRCTSRNMSISEFRKPLVDLGTKNYQEAYCHTIRAISQPSGQPSFPSLSPEGGGAIPWNIASPRAKRFNLLTIPVVWKFLSRLLSSDEGKFRTFRWPPLTHKYNSMSCDSVDFIRFLSDLKGCDREIDGCTDFRRASCNQMVMILRNVIDD